MSLTINVKWSENAADRQKMELEESRKGLSSKISASLEKIRLDLYVAAMIELRDVTQLVRTPFSFGTNLF